MSFQLLDLNAMYVVCGITEKYPSRQIKQKCTSFTFIKFLEIVLSAVSPCPYFESIFILIFKIVTISIFRLNIY